MRSTPIGGYPGPSVLEKTGSIAATQVRPRRVGLRYCSKGASAKFCWRTEDHRNQ